MGTIMSLVNGVKNCEAITDLLNGIIKDTGKAIDIDNQKIWSGFLHQREVDNEFWEQTLDAMEMLVREVPRKFKPFNREAVYNAREALKSFSSNHPRCMDQKENKGKTWKLIMTVREVINAINEIEIPNK
jgi:oligoendopeptidase F